MTTTNKIQLSKEDKKLLAFMKKQDKFLGLKF